MSDAIEVLRHMAGNFAYAFRRDDLAAAANEIERLRARVVELEREREWRPIDDETDRSGDDVLLLVEFGITSGTIVAWWADDGWESFDPILGAGAKVCAWRPVPDRLSLPAQKEGT